VSLELDPALGELRELSDKEIEGFDILAHAVAGHVFVIGREGFEIDARDSDSIPVSHLKDKHIRVQILSCLADVYEFVPSPSGEYVNFAGFGLKLGIGGLMSRRKGFDETLDFLKASPYSTLSVAL
jgi:hypothetical protein